MMIFKGQKGSITERRSLTKNAINISSKNNFNNISVYKRKPNISKRKDNNTNRIINKNNEVYNKIIRGDTIKISLIDNNKNEKKLDSKALKINLEDIINKTKNNKESNLLYPTTSRFDRNIKERYLSKFFIEKVINMNSYQNIEKNDNKYYGTERYQSKKNKSSRNIFIKFENNKNDNNSGLIRNKSMISLGNENKYEIEIRLLEKKLKMLQKTNNKLKVKLFNIKTEQTRAKQNAKKENIISKIIEVYNQYIKKNKCQINNEINLEQNSSILNFKNIILNIMDWKFNYENKLMIEQFYSAINSCFNKCSGEKNLKNCIAAIKILLKKRIELIKEINEMKLYYEKNKIYQIYLKSLCKKNNFQNLMQLEKYLIKVFYKFNEEFQKLIKLKNIVLQNNKKKKIPSNKKHKIKKELNSYNKTLTRRNNSAININKNSRNIDKIYDYYKEPLNDELFFTFRENRQNNYKYNFYPIDYKLI